MFCGYRSCKTMLSATRAQTRHLTSPVSTAPKSSDFTHCVIGGGVVGLAVARQLAKRVGTSTVLLERHQIVGMETSSRNSEVIHAGLYYPTGSLKTELCIKGAAIMYELCEKERIPFRRTGKLILAQDDLQLETLNGIYSHAIDNGVPMRWVSSREVIAREPFVVAREGALESPRTGIVDSHGLMLYLHGAFEEAGGDVVLATSVEKIVPLAGGDMGYRIYAGVPGSPDEVAEITADTVINAAGLSAIRISNMVLPEERHMKAFFCKGTYFSYSASFPKASTLLYPAPVKGFGGLGTHLTLDMTGRIRFGPDVEWTQDPHDLAPNVSRMADAVRAIKIYMPTINETALMPDYCGIRPKIKPQEEGGVGQVDFIIREEDGMRGFVNLLGIESPGLTSSLAIAEKVEDILYR